MLRHNKRVIRSKQRFSLNIAERTPHELRLQNRLELFHTLAQLLHEDQLLDPVLMEDLVRAELIQVVVAFGSARQLLGVDY